MTNVIKIGIQGRRFLGQCRRKPLKISGTAFLDQMYFCHSIISVKELKGTGNTSFL